MTTIRLFADDQKLRVAHDGPCVVSGSRNATVLHVQFGRGWSDYEKSAVFYTTRDDKVYEVLLDEGKCTIPHEVLSLTADLYIGVRGVSSEHQKVKPTSLVKYKIEKGAPVGDGTTVEPTPDVYQQILMRLNDLEVGAGGEVDPVKVTQIVEDYLAEHPGPKGDKGDPGEPGADGKDGTPGKDGVDGKDGADGKSAYQYAQDGGYTGTEEEFVRDLAADKIPAPATAQVGQTFVVKEVDENGKPTSWECVDVAGGGEEAPFASVTMTGSTYPVLAYADNIITVEPTDLDGKWVILRKADHSGGLTIRLVATDTPGQYTIYNMDGGVGIAAYTSIIPDPSVCVVEVRDADTLTISGLGGFDYLKIRITAPLCVSHGMRTTYRLNYPTGFDIEYYYVGKAFESVIESKSYDVIDGKMWITRACASAATTKPNVYNDFSDYVAVPDTLTLSHYTKGLVIGTKLEVWGK